MTNSKADKPAEHLDDVDLDQATGAGTHYAFVKFEANGVVATNSEEIEMVIERLEKG